MLGGRGGAGNPTFPSPVLVAASAFALKLMSASPVGPACWDGYPVMWKGCGCDNKGGGGGGILGVSSFRRALLPCAASLFSRTAGEEARSAEP